MLNRCAGAEKEAFFEGGGVGETGTALCLSGLSEPFGIVVFHLSVGCLRPSQAYLIQGEDEVALRSLSDDFVCILNTYIPKYKADMDDFSPENNIACPLGEIGLLESVDKKKHIYKKKMPPSSLINPWVALAIIMDNANGEKEIPIQAILNGPCNLGKIFNLDTISLIDVLRSIERINKIKIIRTAGLDVIRLNDILSFEDCVRSFYSSI